MSIISSHKGRCVIENFSNKLDLSKDKKRNLIVGLAALLIIVLIVTIYHLSLPNRSVASYCKVYKEENTALAVAKGESYSVTVFSHKSSDPSDFAKAFSKLERVAPDDIRPDVKTLQLLFAKLSNDPSQAISVGLSGVSAETSVKNWTTEHCK